MGAFSACDSPSSILMKSEVEVMPDEKRERQKGAFCGCVITNGFHERVRGVQSYHPHTCCLCSLRCTEIQPLLEAVSYKVNFFFFLFFCFKIFLGEEQT